MTNRGMTKLRVTPITGVIFFVFFVSFFITGCKKLSYDVTKSDKKVESPEYTVEVDPNLSPAEGGVRKPAN